MKNVLFSMLVAIVILTGCKPKQSKTMELQQSKKKVSVGVKKIEKKDLNKYVSITGKIEGKTDITLKSEVSGKIIYKTKKLGDWVNKGDEIAAIDNHDQKNRLEQAKAALLASEGAYENAMMSMNSAKKLYKEDGSGIISKAEFIRTNSELKRALAQFNGAKATLDQAQRSYDNSRFVAPVSGYIANLPIKIGETVNPGTEICNIVDSRKLIIRTGVGEKDIALIKNNQDVEVEHKMSATTITGKIIGKGIRTIRNSANYPIEISLNNEEGRLYPGMVVSGLIHSKTFRDVIYCSLNDVIKEYDNNYVFIIENNQAKRVKVQLGEKIGVNVIINSGLEEGQLLVVDGISNLETDTPVQIRRTVN